MNQHIKRLFVIGAAVMATTTSLRAQDSGIEVGMRAPIVALDDVGGKPVTLADVIGKKPVVLEFWAFWCENCRELEPRMLAAHAKYGKDVAFYGIAVSINQSAERAKKYAELHKFPFPMLWDKVGKAAEDYDVPATSYVVVIDKTGKIVYTGAGGKQDLDAAIRKAF
jgi:cytochrome c biogenesis protein CcmG, thiol:disulfide interchange protein DsbE